MIFLDMLVWWYGPGWLHMLRRINGRTHKLASIFAIPILIKTLFSPWRRIISGGGKGLDGKFQAMLDNLVSRSIGFVVRIMVLIVAGFLITGSLILGTALVIIWPLIPLAAAFSFIKGLMP